MDREARKQVILEPSPENREGGKSCDPDGKAFQAEGTATERPVEKISRCVPESFSRQKEERISIEQEQSGCFGHLLTIQHGVTVSHDSYVK